MRPGADTAPVDLRIRTILGRLDEILDLENASIGRDLDFDLTRSNTLKSRCLYEMTMLFRDAGIAGLGEPHARQLTGIREKLAVNSIKVKAHMDAVREVADLLKKAAQAADADGTYSMDEFMGYDFA